MGAITEDSGPEGWREVAVRDDAGALLAVVTRPCSGADWFLHRAIAWHARSERFKTKKAALAAAST